MELIERFDAAVRDFWQPHPRPTPTSMARINTHFGITLPALLVEFALHSERFHNIFVSLGENYDAHNHIIHTNSHWRRRRRTRRVPANLVIVTQGFMDDDFTCLDISAPAADGSGYELQYWAPAPIGYPRDAILDGERYANFAAFVERVIQTQQPVCAARP